MEKSLNKYENLEKDELIKELLKRDELLKNKTSLNKDQQSNGKTKENAKNSKNKKREFDFLSSRCRPVAFKLAYFGWNYYGFTSQKNDHVETVEKHLFRALETAKFIPNRDSCRYSRSGRTDKGVSAFGQVISLYVRTSLPEGIQGTTTWDKVAEMPNLLIDRTEFGLSEDKTTEEKNSLMMNDYIQLGDDNEEEQLNYLDTINRLLPEDIILEAWCPVLPTFNARFHCHWRAYKYFFSEDDLDIPLMQKAARKFLGRHDFRFFCKVDPTKPEASYTRSILECFIMPASHGLYNNEDAEIGIKRIKQSSNIEDDSIVDTTKDFVKHVGKCNERQWVFFLKGHAFLWHQVRCMMAILFMIGKKQESPEIIDWLFNIEEGKGRPTYDMADDLPLVLYDCGYADSLLNWRRDSEVRIAGSKDGIPASLRTLVKLHYGLERTKRIHHIQMQSFIEGMMQNSSRFKTDIFKYSVTTTGAVCLDRPEKHQPLEQRLRCDSVQSRVAQHEQRANRKRNRSLDKTASN